jgi:REP element-mobilizing transposase RayT
MPNHLHGIVVFEVGAHRGAPLPQTAVPSKLHRPARSLGSFVAGFKSAATKRINKLRRTPGLAVWQRNYYEHIIRDDTALDRIRRYIKGNPLNWDSDGLRRPG